MTEKARRFHVALSFPGNERAVVKPIAECLEEDFGRSGVLYDAFHEAELARPNLDVYLPNLYRTKSELIVVVLGPAYAKQQWCRLEWRYIRTLLKQVDEHRIMFLRVGAVDTEELAEIGILPTDGYIDITRRSASDVALLIKERLASNAGRVFEPTPVPSAEGFHDPLPPDASPGQLLVARYETVPFSSELRADELKALDAWCAIDSSVEIRLFVGPGGSGKTRLFIEWCRHRLGDAWHGTFITDGPDGETELKQCLEGPANLFLVFDYAEARPKLRDMLTMVFRRAKRRQKSQLRIALVARDVGDWWDVLLRAENDLKAKLKQYEVTRLYRPAAENPLRPALFRAAYDEFSAHRDRSGAAPELELSHPRFERVLYLHMAALATVDDLPVRAETLPEDLVEHEGRFWLKAWKERLQDDLDEAEFIESMERVVAGLTLRGGAPDKATTTEIIARVDGPSDSGVVRLLKKLYPGNTADRNPESAYLRPLEPDLLGEALVGRVLHHSDTPEDFVCRVVEGASETAVRTAFTVLGRLSATAGETDNETRMRQTADAHVRRLIFSRPEAHLFLAFEGALAVAEGSAHSRLGMVLAEALTAHGDVALADKMKVLLPWETVSLREVAAWVSGQLLGFDQKNRVPRPEDDNGIHHLANRAIRASNYGFRLKELGRREDALKAIQEAVQICRNLVRRKSGVFEPYLAWSLNNLGNILDALGRREDALEATQEAVQIKRWLVMQRHDTFLPDLAMSLNNLGMMLNTLGRHEDALHATEEAIQLYKKIAAQKPDTFLPNLALSLNNLGLILDKLGNQEGALETTQKAVQIYRNFAVQRPDAFLPDLAMSLNNLSLNCNALGRKEDALEAAQEAVQISRNLSVQRPDAFLSDLATSLNNLGITLSALGHSEDALKATQEATWIYRKLIVQRPDAFLPNLAISLNNLGGDLDTLGRREEALEATQEAVQISIPFTERYPAAFSRRFVTRLQNYIQRLKDNGMNPNADETFCRAKAVAETLGIDIESAD